MPTFEQLSAELREKQREVDRLTEEITLLKRGLMPLESAIKDFIATHCNATVAHVKLFSCSDGSIAPLLYLDRAYMKTIERRLGQRVKVLGMALVGDWLEVMIEMPESIKQFRPENEIAGNSDV